MDGERDDKKDNPLMQGLQSMQGGGQTAAPANDAGGLTAQDYAKSQAQQFFGREGTPEEISNLQQQISVEPGKQYGMRTFYDPLGQKIESPVFATGPSTPTVGGQFPGAGDQSQLPYSQRNAGVVLGADGNLYSTMEHGELVQQTLDPARRQYYAEQAAADAARLGPYSRGQFQAGPANLQLANQVATQQAEQAISAVDPNVLLRAVNIFANPASANPQTDPQAFQLYAYLKQLGLTDEALANVIQRAAMTIQRPVGTRTAGSVLGTPSAAVPTNPLANALKV